MKAIGRAPQAEAQKDLISYIGLGELGLDRLTQDFLSDIVRRNVERIERLVHRDFTLSLHLRKYRSGGSRHMYTAHMRLNLPGRVVAAEAVDWNVLRTVRKGMENLRQQLG